MSPVLAEFRWIDILPMGPAWGRMNAVTLLWKLEAKRTGAGG